MADMNVEIVAVDRKIWSGEATFIFTRTTVGEIGILPRHIPLVAQLVDDAMVRVEREGEKDLRIAVDGGFMSVTEEGVSILAESAEFESEIDEAAAREDSESDDPRVAARGRARLARCRRARLAGNRDERAHDCHGRARRHPGNRRRHLELSLVEATPGWDGGDNAGHPRSRRPRVAPWRHPLPGR